MKPHIVIFNDDRKRWSFKIVIPDGQYNIIYEPIGQNFKTRQKAYEAAWAKYNEHLTKTT